jgi:nanoRNase/pAp phosphatase (c-di-AMP/oligoRNAs hydrolase)
VSLRSRHGIDVSKLAHKYDGGGHVNASGYTVDLPLDDAYDRLLTDMKEIIHASV